MRLAVLFARVSLLPFMLLTVYTLYDVGFIGVFEHQLASSGGWQVFTDLAIALTLIMCWMYGDAKRTGRNVWPYIVITLIAGSFGPLFYVASSRVEDEAR